MEQKEYLKMADVFAEEVQPGRFSYALCAQKSKYAAHAINSHDELVAEVERLRNALSVAASAFDKLQLKEYGKNSFMVSRREMKEFAAHHSSIATAALNHDK